MSNPIPNELLKSSESHDGFLLAQRNGSCRRVVVDRVSFNNFPGTSSSGGTGFGQFLYKGDRVNLLDNGRTTRGDDGQLYLRVSYPYGSSNTSTGYIPTQVEASDGTFKSPLGRCGYPARW
ncbi:MAG: hypothetical protein HC866_22470 [Leptolyngbyaceae cyanobacterium RU_5_1]|nr:hypothetical protein [Leptolyngbyaceae cyanobacterium RU_5_1]